MKRYLTLLACITLDLISCTEEETNVKSTEAPSVTSTIDNSQIQSNFDDINRIVQLSFENANIGESDSSTSSNFDCYEISINRTNKTALITFDSTQICLDGRKRRGMLDISYSGPYRTTGTVITTNLIDYSVNDIKLEGTKKVTNNGQNADGNLEYDILITEAKRTDLDGNIITWTSNRTREWINGTDTPLNITDDVYLITGNASGNNTQGQDFTVNISESIPLKLDISCWITNRVPVSGQVIISPNNEEDRIIDYGNGECNKNLTVTYLNTTFEVNSGIN